MLCIARKERRIAYEVLSQRMALPSAIQEYISLMNDQRTSCGVLTFDGTCMVVLQLAQFIKIKSSQENHFAAMA